MTLSTTQHLALAALADGKHRTRHEIRREAGLVNAVTRGTIPALLRQGLIKKHDALDGPETYTITTDGLSALEAHNMKGRKP